MHERPTFAIPLFPLVCGDGTILNLTFNALLLPQIYPLCENISFCLVTIKLGGYII